MDIKFKDLDNEREAFMNTIRGIEGEARRKAAEDNRRASVETIVNTDKLRKSIADCNASIEEVERLRKLSTVAFIGSYAVEGLLLWRSYANEKKGKTSRAKVLHLAVGIMESIRMVSTFISIFNSMGLPKKQKQQKPETDSDYELTE